MHSIYRDNESQLVIDRQALQTLGVLVPIRLFPLKMMPGRHPLGRAGDGMRFLRTRAFEPGEDNPRDIDKFSPPGERRVVEWEEEAQASIAILADVSASMATPFKAALRNAALLQLTYSLWRAGDRVGTTFFSSRLHNEVRQANLKIQLERLAESLTGIHAPASTDIASAIRTFLDQNQRRRIDLLFLISDFVSMHEDIMHIDSRWQPILKRTQRKLVPVVISYRVPSGIRGMMKLWDPERQRRRLTWFSPGRARRINEEEKHRVAALIRSFKAAGLDYLVLTDQRQIYPQLSTLARQRRRRKN